MSRLLNERYYQITNNLLLNASFIDNLGLMNGKMGICIYIFQIARNKKSKVYNDYANELLDELHEEINEATSSNFEDGLAGIGWGIEFLTQNGYIEADTDEVLEDFDSMLFKELIYNEPIEIGLLNGIIGLGFYFLQRINSPKANTESIQYLTNKQLLIHIIDELDIRTQDTSLIIKEPHIKTNEMKQFESIVSLNNRSKDKNSFLIFSITWDYPVILWFLSELYELNIFNFKVEKIIYRLVKPFNNVNSWPILYCNRLLLVLGLMKLAKLKIDIIMNEEIGLPKIINKLLNEIKRDSIENELSPDNVSIKHGTMGIAWIYQQMYILSSKKELKNEVEHWINKTFGVAPVDNGYAGFNIKEKNKALGILEGLAGIGKNLISFNKKEELHND